MKDEAHIDSEAVAKGFVEKHPNRDFLANGRSLPLVNILWKGLAAWNLRDIEFRPVQNMTELRAASNLAYREYLKRKLQSPHPSHMRFIPHQLLPSSVTFVAIHEQRHVLGTLTLIEDSPLGLPMDKNYKAELDELRSNSPFSAAGALFGILAGAKSHLAEASLLAFDRELTNRLFTKSKRMLVLINFFKMVFDYIRTRTKITEIVACYHPRHDTLYQFLQFQALGGLTKYAIAGDNPAIARHLNISETESKAHEHVAYKLFYGTPAPAEKIKRKMRLSPDDIREMIEISPLVSSALNPGVIQFLKTIYPEYDFSQILPIPNKLAANQ